MGDKDKSQLFLHSLCFFMQLRISRQVKKNISIIHNIRAFQNRRELGAQSEVVH